MGLSSAPALVRGRVEVMHSWSSNFGNQLCKSCYVFVVPIWSVEPPKTPCGCPSFSKHKTWPECGLTTCHGAVQLLWCTMQFHIGITRTLFRGWIWGTTRGQNGIAMGNLRRSVWFVSTLSSEICKGRLPHCPETSFQKIVGCKPKYQWSPVYKGRQACGRMITWHQRYGQEIWPRDPCTYSIQPLQANSKHFQAINSSRPRDNDHHGAEITRTIDQWSPDLLRASRSASTSTIHDGPRTNTNGVRVKADHDNIQS